MYLKAVYGKGGIYAKVVAASIAKDSMVPVYTLELRYPRFIHSEFMTHRVFSRNASSSRAIPVEKMLEQVRNEPAMPIHWGKNKPGMQADEAEVTKVFIPAQDNVGSYHAHPSAMWELAAADASNWAGRLSEEGLHKQIVNRLTEPFQFIKVVVTATEWDNFFVLRLPSEELNERQQEILLEWEKRFGDHPDGKDAQPEIQELVRCMKEVLCEVEHNLISIDDSIHWHLPYITENDLEEWAKGNIDTYTLVKCSTARCARVSYMNHDNTKPNIEKDVKLHDMLLTHGHMSPFEHQAKPIPDFAIKDILENDIVMPGITHVDINKNVWSGNFHGWIQYRQEVS